MHIRSLELKNFRNYADLSFRPGDGLNVLVGPNAQGKSNLLEAITLLATSRSYRAGKDTDLIRWGEEKASAAAQVSRNRSHDVSIEVFLAVGEKKTVRINQSRRHKIADILGQVHAVIFSTEDLELLRGEPSDRRRFLNIEISQASPSYCRHLVDYRRILEQRNRLLKDLQYRPGLLGTLESWNAQMIEHGSRLIFRRWEFIQLIGGIAKEIHGHLSDGQEDLEIAYLSSVALPEEVSLEGIRQSFRQVLSTGTREEIERGMTLWGPHRDDLIFRINGADARAFASQGQQRTVALSLKLAEMELLSEIVGEAPVMLLDDVMSELDDNRRRQVLALVAGKCQTFLTCTNLRALSPEVTEEAAVFEVRGGKIECLSRAD